MKKLVWIFLFSMGVLAPGSAIAGDQPELIGTWHLDTAQSTFGSDPTLGAMALTIMKKGKMVHISQKTTVGTDEKTTENECRTDGKYHPVQGADGGSILCKWEGSTLVIDKQWADGHNHQHILLTLSPDGASATEQIHTQMPGGVNDSNLVLKRQS